MAAVLAGLPVAVEPDLPGLYAVCYLQILEE
jgi:hypothetical protein